MSLYDYNISRELVNLDLPFDALMMAAMARADDHNAGVLLRAFPDLRGELQARYDAPGGLIPQDIGPAGELRSGEPTPCPRCKGDGRVLGLGPLYHLVACPDCGGTGKIPWRPPPRLGQRDWCEVCSGRIVLDNHGEWSHVEARYHPPRPGGSALIGWPTPP
jgi:hypothetical protein